MGLLMKRTESDSLVQRRQRRVRLRATNVDACLEDSLRHLRHDELPADVALFQAECLPGVPYDRLLRAARVAKDAKTYEDISRGHAAHVESLVELSREERDALVKEHDSVIPEPGMLIVILTVSLAAFLQGHVQSSINSASLYHENLDIHFTTEAALTVQPGLPSPGDWTLGGINAAPFLAAGCLGCWLAPPLSDRFGRRGSMQVAALLVCLTSALMAAVPFLDVPDGRWKVLLAIRIVNGMGMGIKAVNTPMLASETAIGYWRGTSILAWQLWVACGIMIGFVFNAVFATADDEQLTLALVLGAPMIPSILLLAALFRCPESPRYYMRPGPRYDPVKAYHIMKRLRRCELIAMRDIYVLHKSIKEGYESLSAMEPATSKGARFIGLRGFIKQYLQLFRQTRLRNALISSCIVALSQQLCGINILAFYSGTLFTSLGSNRKASLYFSVGFDPSQLMRLGAINFLAGLPAFRTIDTLGRRKWMIATLPPMAILLASAATSFVPAIRGEGESNTTTVLVTVFLFLHAVFYSPGMGPIPFTIAAESFPLTHRELGCAFAISVNLLFAGILSLAFPSLLHALTTPGTLGLFSGLTSLAFLLIFLFVEETRQMSLEDLDFIYGVSKLKFVHYQVFEYLPWLLGQHLPWLVRHYVPWCLTKYVPAVLLIRILGDTCSMEQVRDLEAAVNRRKPRKPRRPQLYTFYSET